MTLTHVRQLFWAGEVWWICEVFRKIGCCLNKIITWIIAFRIILEREKKVTTKKLPFCFTPCIKRHYGSEKTYNMQATVVKSNDYEDEEKSEKQMQLTWLLSYPTLQRCKDGPQQDFPRGLQDKPKAAWPGHPCLCSRPVCEVLAHLLPASHLWAGGKESVEVCQGLLPAIRPPRALGVTTAPTSRGWDVFSPPNT